MLVTRPTAGSPDHVSWKEHHLRGTSPWPYGQSKSKSFTTSYFSLHFLLLPSPSPPPLASLPSTSSSHSSSLPPFLFPTPLPPFSPFFYSHPPLPFHYLIPSSFLSTPSPLLLLPSCSPPPPSPPISLPSFFCLSLNSSKPTTPSPSPLVSSSHLSPLHFLFFLLAF